MVVSKVALFMAAKAMIPGARKTAYGTPSKAVTKRPSP